MTNAQGGSTGAGFLYNFYNEGITLITVLQEMLNNPGTDMDKIKAGNQNLWWCFVHELLHIYPVYENEYPPGSVHEPRYKEWSFTHGQEEGAVASFLYNNPPQNLAGTTPDESNVAFNEIDLTNDDEFQWVLTWWRGILDATMDISQYGFGFDKQPLASRFLFLKDYAQNFDAARQAANKPPAGVVNEYNSRVNSFIALRLADLFQKILTGEEAQEYSYPHVLATSKPGDESDFNGVVKMCISELAFRSDFVSDLQEAQFTSAFEAQLGKQIESFLTATNREPYALGLCWGITKGNSEVSWPTLCAPLKAEINDRMQDLPRPSRRNPDWLPYLVMKAYKKTYNLGPNDFWNSLREAARDLRKDRHL